MPIGGGPIPIGPIPIGGLMPMGGLMPGGGIIPRTRQQSLQNNWLPKVPKIVMTKLAKGALILAIICHKKVDPSGITRASTITIKLVWVFETLTDLVLLQAYWLIDNLPREGALLAP